MRSVPQEGGVHLEEAQQRGGTQSHRTMDVQGVTIHRALHPLSLS